MPITTYVSDAFGFAFDRAPLAHDLARPLALAGL